MERTGLGTACFQRPITGWCLSLASVCMKPPHDVGCPCLLRYVMLYMEAGPTSKALRIRNSKAAQEPGAVRTTAGTLKASEEKRVRGVSV